MTQELRILWLYPDILNLHGDRGNAMALVRVCGQAGVTASITRVDRLADPIDLEAADLVLVGPGELAVMADVVRALSPYSQGLAEMVDAGTPMLVSGTSAGIVARTTARLDSSRFDGLGLVGMEVVEREEILGDDLILDVGGREVGGMQIRMADLRLDPGQAPFGSVLYGWGNDHDHPDAEGARRGNLVATNLLGPSLVKNPWFAWRLIEQALTNRYGEAPPAPDQSLWAFERRGAEAIRRFNVSKQILPGTVRRLNSSMPTPSRLTW